MLARKKTRPTCRTFEMSGALLVVVLLLTISESQSMFSNETSNSTGCGSAGSVCSPFAICDTTSDISAASSCQCNIGYEGNGTSCEDVNECRDPIEKCSTPTACVNTNGSFYCACSNGCYGSDPTDCQACDSGKYNDIPGSITCYPCSAGKYCLFDHRSADCSVMNACPDNSTSPARSGGLQDCRCNAGFITVKDPETHDLTGCSECNAGYYLPAGPPATACRLCERGKYSDSTAATGCKLCAAHSSSPSGSDSASNCTCNAGFTVAQDGVTCSPCPAGTVKTIAGPFNCTECIAGTYSTALGSGRDCKLCSVGKYSTTSAANSDSFCLSCPTLASSAAGSTGCVCPHGYSFMDGLCIDIDECLESIPTLNDCDCNADCNNTIGSFSCTCSEGYYGEGTVGTCVDVCKQKYDLCDSNSACIFTDDDPAVYRCACLSGFTLVTDHPSAPCPTPSPSRSLPTGCSYLYSLPATYPLDDFVYPDSQGFIHQYARIPPSDLSCVDFDECMHRSENCDVHATCTNTMGSFTCACNAGWNGTGLNQTCKNIDECKLHKDNCDPLAHCFDTLGSFTCVCRCGYEGNGTFCQDVDECAANSIQHSTIQTVNKNNSNVTKFAFVESRAGFQNSTYDCVKQVNGSNRTVALRVQNNCDPNAECNNTIGSFVCSCMLGYQDRSTGKSIAKGTNCSNINECSLGIDNCDTNAACVDTPGSFSCTCNAGFQGIGVVCQDRNECSETIAVCAHFANCNNTVGSFTCACDAGFYGADPFACQPCPLGTFKATAGPDFAGCTPCSSGTYSSTSAATSGNMCISCPVNSNSKVGTSSFSGCNCNAGFTLANRSQTCVQCAAGTFKDVEGQGPCSVCPAGKYSAALAAISVQSCVKCPTNSFSLNGSSKPSNCTCNPGYTGSTSCIACLAGTYKSTSGSSECVKCTGGKFSTSLAASGASVCLPCTNNSFSSNGSSAASDCICNAGFTSSAAGCLLCPKGSYKNITGPSACFPCTSNSDSPRGSIDQRACTCNAGYAMLGDLCEICDPGHYSNGSMCLLCPDHMISDQGSQHIFDCSCNAGYFGQDGIQCQPCPPGSYKQMIGSLDCSACPPNSFSNQIGSVALIACTCNTGYHSSQGTSCADVDECSTSKDNNCRGLAGCVNTIGSYFCTCSDFFVLNKNGTDCLPKIRELELIGVVFASFATFKSIMSQYQQIVAWAFQVPVVDFHLIGTASSLEDLMPGQISFLQSDDSSPLLDPGSAVLRGSSQNLGLTLNFGSGRNLFASISLAQQIYFRAEISTVNDSEFKNVSNITLINQQIAQEVQRLNLPSVEILDIINRKSSRCGDKIIDFGEICDDGNIAGGDGCSSMCQIETGWRCNDVSNNGSTCFEIDECKTSTINCDVFALCVNTIGSYICTCLFDTIDIHGDGTFCEETPLSQAQNTSFSITGTLIPSDPKTDIVQAVGIYQDTLLISRAGPGSGISSNLIYERQGNSPWPSLPSYVLDLGKQRKSGVFGVAVAISHSNAVVATNVGEVHIFIRGVTRLWNTTAAIILIREESFFGSALAMSESELIVGAYGAGKAFLYKQSYDGSWPIEPSVVFESGPAPAMFGHCVAMSSNHIAIGALYGAKAYVYVKAANETWPQQASFVLELPSETNAFSFFGPSLSMTDNTIFVGVPSDRRVLIFSRFDDGSWPTNPTMSLSVWDNMFGYCVVNTDRFALVTAYDSNRAYLFKTARNGSWLESPVQRISESGVPSHFLGYSCAMSNFDVALGSHQVRTELIRLLRAALILYKNYVVLRKSFEQTGNLFIHTAGCAVNFYGWTLNDCQRCPPFTSSPYMSRNISDCVCQEGYYGSGGQCSICPADSYCPGGSQIGSCTGSTRSPHGSTSAADCVSNAFLVKAIQQSSNLPGTKNYLNVTLVTNAFFSPVEATEEIYLVIQGIACLEGCKPCQNGSIDFSCPPSRNGCPFQLLAFRSDGPSLLDGAGLPTGSGLFVNLTQPLQQAMSYSFTFCFENPEAGQFPPVLSIMATSGGELYSVPQIMDVGYGALSPLAILGFYKAAIGQSTASQFSNNSITVSIQLYSVMPRGSQLTIHSLTGSQSYANIVMIESPKVDFPVERQGKWNFSSSELVLTLENDMAGGTMYVFSFVLFNGDVSQFSPTVSISASVSSVSIPAINMTTPQNNSAVLLIAGFSVKGIVQNTTVPGSTNFLFVALEPRMDLSPGDVLTISGLVHSRTPTGTIKLASNSNKSSNAINTFGSTARWNQISGSLTLLIRAPWVSGNQIDFSFAVKNPLEGQNSPQVSILCTGSVNSSEIMEGGSNISAPFLIAGFRTKTIQQDSPWPGCENLLSITLNVFVPLKHAEESNTSPAIYFTGLIGSSQTKNFKILPGRENNSTWWNETIMWDAVVGTLVLRILDESQLVPNVDYELRIELTNGQMGQAAPVIMVAGSGPLWSESNDISAAEVMDGGPSGNAALEIAGLNNVLASQTSCVPAGNNSISVSFELFVDLPIGTLVTISGLLGSETATQVNLAVMTGPESFAANGFWNQTAGTLVLNTSRNLVAKSFLGTSLVQTIRFTLQNPKVMQHAADLMLSVMAHTACMSFDEMCTNGPGNQAPFLVAGLLNKTLSQTNASLGGSNSLILTLKSTADILKGSLMSIYGLTCQRCTCFECCLLKLASITRDGVQLNTSLAVFQATRELTSTYPLNPLTLLFVRNFSADHTYVFKFSLRNPKCLGYGDSSANISLSPPFGMIGPFAKFPIEPLEVASGLFAPLLICFFSVAEAVQSNSARSALNNITITFEVNCPIAVGSKIVVLGLRNSNTSSGPIILYGDNSSVFAGATWNSLAGRLEANIGVAIRANQFYRFYFQLLNPSQEQDAPPLTIQALDPLAFTFTEVTQGTGSAAPFLIIEFINKRIGQNSALGGGRNTITVTISVSSAMSSGSEVTIAGLLRTRTTDRMLHVASPGRNTLMPFFNFGTWAQANGTLTVTVAQGKVMNPFVDYTFSFNITNPLAAQASTIVSISAKGSALISWVQMDKGYGIEAPLLITTKFVFKNMWQATPSAGSNNSLTVTLATNNGIYTGDGPKAVGLTIGGLSGTATPVGKLSLTVYGSASNTTFPGNTASLLGQVGDRVLGVSKAGYWIPASIVQVLDDGFLVSWDKNYPCDKFSGGLNFSSFCDKCTVNCSHCSTCLSSGQILKNFRNCTMSEVKPLSSSAVDICGRLIQRVTGSFSNANQLTLLIGRWQREDIVCNTIMLYFTMVNSEIPQVSPSIRIMSTELNITSFEVDKAEDVYSPLSIAGFLSATISQSNPSQGVRNVLAATFITQTNLTTFSQIQITGLQGAENLDCACPPGQAPPFLLEEGAPLFMANFSSTTASVLLTSTSKISGLKPIKISFAIKNQQTGQDPPPIFIEGLGGIRMARYRMATTAGSSAAMLIADLKLKSINQSSVYISSKNTYNVEILLNVPLDSGATLYITGLFGKATNPLSVRPSKYFSGVYSPGQVTITAISSLFQNQQYGFSFDLQNQDGMNNAPSISIAISGGMNVMAAAMTSGQGNAAAGLVAGFYMEKGSISQSSPGQGSPNVLTVKFTLNVDIPWNNHWTIIMSNLKNLRSALAGSAFPLRVNFTRPSGIAFANLSADSLAISLNGLHADANTSIQFSFSLKNPARPQVSTAATIQLFADSNNEVVPVTDLYTPNSASGNQAPLFVIGFLAKNIIQNTASATTMNTLTVELSTSGDLTSNSTITISGLKGSLTVSKSISLSFGMENVIDPVAYWNASTGSLIVGVRSNWKSMTSYKFSFLLQNPSTQQSHSNPIVETSNPRIYGVQMDLGSGNAAPLKVAGFISKQIGQSNAGVSAQNTISVTLSTSVDVAGGQSTFFTLSGLTATATVDNNFLPINSTAFASSGQWKRENGTLVVGVSSLMVAATTYVFSFALINPGSFQKSPLISIECNGYIKISKVEMSKSAGNNAPLLVAGFLTATISQSTPSAAEINTLTVLLMVNVDLKRIDDVITITGLTGSNTNSTTALPVQVLRNQMLSTSFGPRCLWIQSNGSLILVVQSTLYANFEYELSFTLQNPIAGQESPNISISASGIRIPSRGMDKVPANKAPLLVAGFLLKSVGQRTPTTSITNTITVTISCRTSIAQGSYVTVSGLDGAQGSATDLHLNNLNGSTNFGDRASWNQGDYTLTVTVIKKLHAKQPYVFSFMLLNPSFGQSAPTVSMKVTGRVSTSWTIVDSASGNNAPLVVSGFYRKDISQSNPSSSLANTITATVGIRVSLTTQTTLLISGLTGSLTKSGLIPVGGNFSQFVGQQALWNSTTGSLSMTITQDTSSVSVYVISFTLQNPAQGQSSPAVFVQTYGAVVIQQVEMDRAQGNFAPLAVAGFVVRKIGQSDPGVSRPNMIFVTLSCSVSLVASNITISGLTGSITPSNSSLPINSTIFGKSGKWTKESGTLILGIKTSMDAGKEYVLSFALKNPSSAQLAPNVSVECNGLIKVTISGMNSSSGNVAALLVAGFLVANVSQSTPSAHANNIITIFLAVNIYLEPGFTFLVNGLGGSQTKSTDSLQLVSNPANSLMPFGSWSQGGSLRFQTNNLVSPRELLKISFVLINPEAGQDSAMVNITTVGISFAPTTLSQDGNVNFRPLQVASFAIKQIGQSNPSASLRNRITATLRANVWVPIGCDVTISGLVGTGTMSSVNFPIYDTSGIDASPIFKNSTWNQTAGTLVLVVARNIESGTDIVFSFLLINPAFGQDAPTLSIEMNGNIHTSKVSLKSAPGNYAPLLISDIILKSIGQSSASNSVNNTITVTIGIRVSLTTQTTLLISGLTGSLTKSGLIPVGGNFSQFVGQQALWNSTTGSLSMTITQDTSSVSVYVISFTLQNPAQGQSSPAVFVQTYGAVVIQQVEMDRAQGNFAPLAVAGFVVRKIGQSDPGVSRPNMIFVTLSCSVSLVASNITISGLTGSITPSNRSLPINSTIFGKSGQWTNESGTLILGIKTSMDAGKVYVLSFALTNPSTAQSIRAVSIEGSGQALISKASMTQDYGLRAPLVVVTDLYQVIITQSTVNAGAMNTITTTLAASDAFVNGSQITISGLLNSSSLDSDVTNFTSTCNFSQSLWSYLWNHLSGEMTFILSGTIPARSICVISFVLANPSIGQDAPPLTISGSGVWIAPKRVDQGSGMSAVFLVADFTEAHIEQSTPFFNQINTFRAYFSTRTGLKSPAKIILTGLTGQYKPRNTSVKLCLNASQLCWKCNSSTSKTSPCWVSNWDPSVGIFVLVINNDTLPTNLYVLSFEVVNPEMYSNASKIYIQATGQVMIATTTMKAAKGNSAPLLTAGWILDRLSIGQSTIAASAINKITLTLAVWVQLQVTEEVQITVSGLSGSATPSGMLPISGPAALGTSAIWMNEINRGTLIFTLFSDLYPESNYEIIMYMANPSFGQDAARNVSIEANGISGNLIPRGLMKVGQGNHAPFLVAGFLAQPVVLFHRSASEGLTIILSSRTRLNGFFGTKFTISGLAGSGTPGANSKLTLLPPLSNFGSFCRWFQKSGKLVLIVTGQDVSPFQQLNATFDLDDAINFVPMLINQHVMIQASLITLNEIAVLPLISPVQMITAGFLIRTINVVGSANYAPNAINVLLVVLSSNIDILVPLDIVFTGLTGTAVPSDTIDVTGSKVFTKSAVWSPANGTLKVQTVASMLASQEYNFSFKLQNGPMAQNSPNITISGSCKDCDFLFGSRVSLQQGTREQFLAPVIMQVGSRPSLRRILSEEVAAQPLKIAGWIEKTIHHSTVCAGAQNILTVTLRCSATLQAQTMLIISGLLGPTDEAGSKRILSSSSDSMCFLAEFGVWDHAQALLVVQLLEDWIEGSRCTFNFQLTNPIKGQSSPPISIEARGPTWLQKASLDSPHSRPLEVAGFVVKYIGQSTASASANNRIFVRFSTYSALSPAQQSRLIIQGLIGSQTQSAKIHVTSHQRDHPQFATFAPTAIWESSNGTLILIPNIELKSLTEYTLSFTLRNPILGQDSPIIRVISENPDSSVYLMDKDRENLQPLLVADFLQKSIGQSSVSQHARNVVTITIRMRTVLLAGSFVTVSGLTGSATPDSESIQVQKRSPHNRTNSHFLDVARWVKVSGTVVFAVIQDTVPNASYVMSFELINCGMMNQKSSSISISSSGVVIGKTQMDIAEGNAAPLLVAGFSLFSVEETFMRTFNKSFVVFKLKTNVLLSALQNCRLTISGLYPESKSVTQPVPIHVESDGTVSPALGTSGSWISPNALVLNVISTIDPDITYKISFHIDRLRISDLALSSGGILIGDTSPFSAGPAIGQSLPKVNTALRVSLILVVSENYPRMSEELELMEDFHSISFRVYDGGKCTPDGACTGRLGSESAKLEAATIVKGNGGWDVVVLVPTGTLSSKMYWLVLQHSNFYCAPLKVPANMDANSKVFVDLLYRRQAMR